MTAHRSRRVPPAKEQGHRAPLATAPTAGRRPPPVLGMVGGRIILLALALGLLAALPYLHGIGNSFIELDDPGYVTENVQVLRGLTREGVGWALTTFRLANWHPLTWLSHMADVSLFGVDPRGHHLVSILLHALNAALLFLALFRLTASPGPSAFTAALFGVHPLHVESVAWVSERKDLLSGLFFMLVLLAYERYARRGKGVRLLAVALLLALGLTAKPMLVTAPFVLLLLDVWPLGRTPWAPPFVPDVACGCRGGSAASPAGGGEWAPEPWSRLLLEKVPLLALSLASGVVTFLAQREAGAVVKIEAIPAVMRLANALVSYAAYLGKAAWPSGLVVLYPYPMQWYPISKVLVSVVVLAVLTWAVFSRFRRAPFLAVGWLWFVGMLVPVIGLVQVGNQAMADRYTYLPLVGVFIAVAWGVPRMFPGGSRRAVALGAYAGAAIVLLSTASWVQVGWWKDSPTLFERTLSLTSDNWLIENNLGIALFREGKVDEAVVRYGNALRLNPDYPEAHNNLGNALFDAGKPDEALVHIREALRLRPDYPEVHNNLGNILITQGKLDEAMVYIREALRLRPEFPEAHNNLGNALFSKGMLDEAIVHYRAALRFRPDFPAAHNNLGNALVREGNVDEATVHYREALRIRPDFPAAQNNLGTILSNQGNSDEAMVHYREALRIQPDSADTHFNLGKVLAARGNLDEAMLHFREALRLRPDFADAHFRLGKVLAAQGNLDDAIAEYREELRLRPDYPEAHNNLGNILVRRGNPDEAMVHFREALRLRPDLAGTHYNLGTILAARGSLDDAMVHFREALRLQPDFAEAHESLAAVLRQLGRHDEARRHLEEAGRLRGSVPPPGERP